VDFMEYVSPHYRKTLEHLAETLVNPERFGQVAVAQEVQLALDIPENIVVGVE
jgi:hypothetical protein